LVLFVRAPVDGHFWSDVFPSMTLLGFGAGMALNPVLLAAMGDVPQSDAGLASGVVNTSFMMGGALGLAVLASVAASRTSHLLASGHARPEALVGGYHVAFLIGAGFAALASLAAAWLLRTPAPAGESEATEPAAHSESSSSRHVGGPEPVTAEC
jgi:MFS family permease